MLQRLSVLYNMRGMKDLQRVQVIHNTGSKCHTSHSKNNSCRFFCPVWHKTQTLLDSERFGASQSLHNRVKLQKLLVSSSGASVSSCSRRPELRHVLVNTGSQFCSRGDTEQSRQPEGEGGRQKRLPPIAAWIVRFANENSYLGWCRNTYLATIIAIVMLGHGSTLESHYAADGVFFIAGLNLAWGTYIYIYVLHLRQRVAMTIPGAFLQVAMAAIHLLLWWLICLLYTDLPEDPYGGKASDKMADEATELFRDREWLPGERFPAERRKGMIKPEGTSGAEGVATGGDVERPSPKE